MIRTTVLLLTLSLVSSSCSRGAVFLNLGDIAGGDFYSEATAVSADGSTVVGFSKTSFTEGLTSYSNVDEAFRWSLDTGLVAMGDLAGGTFASRANGVSGDGSVIVGGGSSASGGEAFRWTAGGGLVGIGELTGGDFFSQANDVSADGSRVVGVSESTSGTEAFQYDVGAGMIGLGDLPGDTFRSSANAISDNGLVVVGQSDSSVSMDDTIVFDVSFDEAFRAPVIGSMTGLGILGETPSISCDCDGSGATATSEDGSVLVGWTSTTAPLPIHTAFRWTAADGMELLDAAFSQLSTIPNDISADGSVVVGRYGSTISQVIYPEDPSEAFIWTESSGVINLQQHLEDVHGLTLPGWTLESATGVSADGTVITGYGLNPDGNREAWVVSLAVVPEPGAVSLVLLAAPWLTGRLGRRAGAGRLP